MTAENLFDGLGLSDEERKSLLWSKIRGYITESVRTLRLRNDSLRLSDEETRIIRIKIALLNEILASGELPGQESVSDGDAAHMGTSDGASHWSEQ